MDNTLRESFVIWDRQVNDRFDAYITLNNTYLAVERGDLVLDARLENELWNLVRITYPYNKEKMMNQYWMDELEKLPGWIGY